MTLNVLLYLPIPFRGNIFISSNSKSKIFTSATRLTLSCLIILGVHVPVAQDLATMVEVKSDPSEKVVLVLRWWRHR